MFIAQTLAVNGKILNQQLNANGKGYTVIRLWGSYYKMGYAHATLLGDHIVKAIGEVKAYLGSLYDTRRSHNVCFVV